jgi:hypothetical protein
LTEKQKIKTCFVVCVVYAGVLDSVEVFKTRTEAESRRFALQVEHENDDDIDVSLWDA